jgi:hypothetical protein
VLMVTTQEGICIGSDSPRHEISHFKVPPICGVALLL